MAPPLPCKNGPFLILAFVYLNPSMISVSSRRFAAAFVSGLFLASSLLAASRWADVTSADFTNAPAPIDPDAGAEILLAETSMDESMPNDIRWTYFIRVRIVDERGVGRFRKIELPYDGNMSITGIEARTFKPDGSVLVLDKKEVFDRDLVKTRFSRRSVKSFAPAGLEPGVIFEYTYVERRDRITPVWPLYFQRDVPARVVRYRLRPYAAPGFDLRSMSFNLPSFSLKPDSLGFFTFEATNLKGWKNEPFQFPPIQLQSSAVIYYNPQDGKLTPEAYWQKAGAKLHGRTESAAKPTKAVQAALAGIVSRDDTPDVKIRKIYDYVRTKLVNRDLDIAGYTREQRGKLPKNDNAEETLAHGQGNGDDLALVFIALARAAGFDARLAQTNDRTFIIYNDKMREPFVFRKLVAAVRMGETWTFCDPGAIYLPFGMIDWKCTGTVALVADRAQALLPAVPLTPSKDSVRTRKAVFTLDEQGVLEGRVTMTTTGYADVAAKNRYDALSAEEREKNLKEEVQKQFPLAELSEIVFEHASDPLRPMVLSYQLRVPGFAERTGSRLFVQPAALHKGQPPMFDAPERRSPVVFNHQYREVDDIEITVPTEFTLEAGNAPPGVDLGKFGRYDVRIGYGPKNRKITYAREFEIFASGFPVKFYPAVKQLLEEVNAQDNHTLTFRSEAEAAATADKPAAATGAEEKKG
jgi:transglutaminase-like putative cysteine protease